MSQKDGKYSEKFFKEVFQYSYPKLHIEKIGNPCDFLINSTYIEVKSCNLMVKKYKENDYLRYGRFEHWNNSQIEKLEKLNPYVCFMVGHKYNYLILGFVKYKHIPKKKLISIRDVMGLKLLTTDQMVKRIRNKKFKRDLPK